MYIRENVYFGHYSFSSLSSTKLCLRFLLNFFSWEIKRPLSEFLRNEFDFRGIIKVFLNILAKNQNFKKLRHDFVDKRALITTTLISSCHLKILVPFCFRKTWTPENAFLTRIFNSKLSQNRTEKQIMLFKTIITWRFNDTFDVI